MRDVKNRAEKLSALKNGRGIQYLLDEGYRILGYPLLIHDMEYKLVANSDSPITDDPIWSEFILNGRLSDETIEFCKDEGFIDNVSYCTNHGGITYLISDKLKHDRIFGQLYSKKQMPVAALIALTLETPFDEDTPELIKLIRGIISKELYRSEYYHDYGQIYQENIVKKLIDGSIEDKELYTGHVANIDQGLKTNIFVAVADIAQTGRGLTGLVYFRDLFKQAYPDFKCYIYANRIVILISSDNTSQNPKKEINRLEKLFRRENIYAGVSSGFENLFEMPAYYDEAVRALESGLRSGCDKRIFYIDEAGRQ